MTTEKTCSCGKPSEICIEGVGKSLELCRDCYTRPAPPAAKESVNHPAHYRSHPSGVECITVVEQFNFNVGNAIKYLWRCGLKGDEIEDLKKSLWYVQREIDKREKEAQK